MLAQTTLLLLVASTLTFHSQHVHPAPSPGGAEQPTSALTADAVRQLLAGDGMGLARPAEMNGYPGPKHVLELKKELQLTGEQEQALEAIRHRMLAQATRLGAAIVAEERALDSAFRAGSITAPDVLSRIASLAKLQGELRAVHLQAHVEARPVTTAAQVRAYYRLRATAR